MSEKFEQAVILDPVIGLKRKLSLPGGISREAALARAHDRLQDQRKDALEDLVARIAALRRENGRPFRVVLSRQEAADLMEQLDEIMNIAGTFHLWNLVTAAALLCDLLCSRTARLRLNADAINTFIHAMHLFAIPSGRFDADGLAVLEHLRRLFSFVAPGECPSEAVRGAA